MEITPITVQVADLDVEALDRTGNIALLSGVDVAITPEYVAPDSTTVWVAATYASGVATFTIAGPEAVVNNLTGVVRVPDEGGVLWARITDNPEINVVAIETIAVL